MHIDDPFVPEDIFVFRSHKNLAPRQVHIVEVDKKDNKCLIHYVGQNKRLDDWVAPETLCRFENATPTNGARKRRKSIRGDEEHSDDTDDDIALDAEPSSDPLEAPPTHDASEGNRKLAMSRIEKVMFGSWLMKTWYYSPYPIPVVPVDEGNPLRHGRMVGTDLLPDGSSRTVIQEASVLWVCHQCFKYMSKADFDEHISICPHIVPPGRKVYQHGDMAMYEVDGAEQKVYCQNISLFCKFFIDVKTLYFDCESFLFYVLTKTTGDAEDVVGYFSKEKISFDRNNLACILTLPPYQKNGYGMLMIEFSYELSRRANVIGGPEGPLSDLGLLSYMSYWVSTLIRFFRQRLSILPGFSRREDVCTSGTPFDILKNYTTNQPRRYGYESEDSDSDSEDGYETPIGASTFHHRVTREGTLKIDVVYQATLDEIVAATFLKPRDAAFALKEIGFLVNQIQTPEDVFVVVTHEMVESVARRRKIRQPRFERQYVL